MTPSPRLHPWLKTMDRGRFGCQFYHIYLLVYYSKLHDIIQVGIFISRSQEMNILLIITDLISPSPHFMGLYNLLYMFIWDGYMYVHMGTVSYFSNHYI